MNNCRTIVLQILDVIGRREKKGLNVDEFLTLVEMQAMTELIAALPEDKQQQVIDQFITLPQTPQKEAAIFGPYYTLAERKEALTRVAKQAIAQQIVAPHDPQLSPAQRESILALLEQLTC